jgi:hypothetical protein
LLGDTWTLVRAPSGSSAFQLPDVTAVPALGFAGGAIGSYDTFSQTFATINDLGAPGSNAPSGLLVTTSASAVPEPSTWLLALVGFAGLGYAGYRGARAPRAA